MGPVDETRVLATIAGAVGLGLLAQLLAYRFRLPSIVLLLAFGVLFGSAGLGLVEVRAFQGALGVLVKLAVAVILFEGALNLRLEDLRRAATPVRNLVTLGVGVTWGGATLAARFLAGLPWLIAIVFGALVTVTGPTVVQPLLKRLHVPGRIKAILEGEAILVDPIGAILAVAVFDAILSLYGLRSLSLAEMTWGYLGRLLAGVILGSLGGWGLSQLFQIPRLVPPEFRNLVALAGVWVVFALAETAKSEAGIMAAVAMGLVFQRGEVPELRRLRSFKEQLTVLAISLLFILLAADLDLAVVRAEGSRGMATVLVLMFGVRPLAVWLSTRRTGLPWQEKLFIAWIGPRGIVAASVASLFALRLREVGFQEGDRLLALTFLTVALTVTLQGLTAGGVARLLGLRSSAGRLAVIVGAGPLGRAVAHVLKEHGRPVVMVDRNPNYVFQARREGLEAHPGNALEEETLEQAGADEAGVVLATTPNPEVNVLVVQLAREAFHIRDAYAVLDAPHKGAGPQLVEQVGGRTAFGRPLDISAWEHALRNGSVVRFTWEVPEVFSGSAVGQLGLPEELLPIVLIRGDTVEITHSEQTWRKGDKVVFLSLRTEGEARQVLERRLA